MPNKQNLVNIPGDPRAIRMILPRLDSHDDHIRTLETKVAEQSREIDRLQHIRVESQNEYRYKTEIENLRRAFERHEAELIDQQQAISQKWKNTSILIVSGLALLLSLSALIFDCYSKSHSKLCVESKSPTQATQQQSTE